MRQWFVCLRHESEATFAPPRSRRLCVAVEIHRRFGPAALTVQRAFLSSPLVLEKTMEAHDWRRWMYRRKKTVAGKPRTIRRRPAYWRPWLEPLEDRTVPSVSV